MPMAAFENPSALLPTTAPLLVYTSFGKRTPRTFHRTLSHRINVIIWILSNTIYLLCCYPSNQSPSSSFNYVRTSGLIPNTALLTMYNLLLLLLVDIPGHLVNTADYVLNVP